MKGANRRFRSGPVGPERREKVHLSPGGCNEGQAFRIRDNFGMRVICTGAFASLLFRLLAVHQYFTMESLILAQDERWLQA